MVYQPLYSPRVSVKAEGERVVAPVAAEAITLVDKYI